MEAGRFPALYVVDPGPEGSLGDVSWVAAARQSGKVSLLVYQGVLSTELARAADIVLPGSAWVEKDVDLYQRSGPGPSRGEGVCRARRGAGRPGYLHPVVAQALGQPVPYASAAEVRAAIAEALKDNAAYAGLGAINFGRPMTAKHWLQASNPSERWKWDFMFQEVNTQKWDGLTAALPQLNIIPLTPVQDGPKGDAR